MMPETILQAAALLEKCPTGITGLDEITRGGLPRGRPTLVCGNAGTGKTMLALEFLVRGAIEFDEPGIFLAFEESAEELICNASAVGYDLRRWCEEGRLAIDAIRVDPSEIEEAGEYGLEGLFIRIQCAVQRTQARRIALDSLEVLFSGLQNQSTVRRELQRLFRWLKEQKLTALVTAERGQGALTRHGIEEYVADCVISLDHEVVDRISTRHIRVVKYRGSEHETNEYPFLIGGKGIAVFPITSVSLESPVCMERISSGVPHLDAMLKGKGFFRGSTILVSGTTGTGKSSLAGHFARAACERGERALYFAFEESAEQIIRNMRSIGIDLQPYVSGGVLQIVASRPTSRGLETHLAAVFDRVREFAPAVVVFDPMTDFAAVASRAEVKVMLTRLIDFLKMQEITTLFISLTSGEHGGEQSEAQISSLIDSWVLLRNVEQNGERNRALYLLKSRGMAHSSQVREFLLTDEGVKLVNVSVGPEGVLTGSARKAHEAHLAQLAMQQKQETEYKRRQLESRRAEVEAQIEALRHQLEREEHELALSIEQLQLADLQACADRRAVALAREFDMPGDDAGERERP